MFLRIAAPLFLASLRVASSLMGPKIISPYVWLIYFMTGLHNIGCSVE